jgi:hypothetical protein
MAVLATLDDRPTIAFWRNMTPQNKELKLTKPGQLRSFAA